MGSPQNAFEYFINVEKSWTDKFSSAAILYYAQSAY